MIVNGTASGLGAGTADITASANGVTSGNVVLTVIAETPPPPVLTSIVVSPSAATIHVGQTHSSQPSPMINTEHRSSRSLLLAGHWGGSSQVMQGCTVDQNVQFVGETGAFIAGPLPLGVLQACIIVEAYADGVNSISSGPPYVVLTVIP
jgi:hypothetical protein